MSKKKRFYKRLIEWLLTLIGICITLLAVVMYLKAINQKAKELSDDTSATVTVSKDKVGSNGFYIANVKKDLLSYIKKHKKSAKNLTSFTYKIEDEKMYYVILVNKNEGEYSFELSKIVDDYLDVNTKLNYRNIERIDYKTGNSNYATVLNLISASDNRYLVFAENGQQFLGNDIESISYINDHFYYLTYNPLYNSLRNADSCSEEVKEEIEDFNMYDEYYSYGKINFLSDYYQKTASTKFTVKERCEELDRLQSEKEEQSSQEEE